MKKIPRSESKKILFSGISFFGFFSHISNIAIFPHKEQETILLLCWSAGHFPTQQPCPSQAYFSGLQDLHSWGSLPPMRSTIIRDSPHCSSGPGGPISVLAREQVWKCGISFSRSLEMNFQEVLTWKRFSWSYFF